MKRGRWNTPSSMNILYVGDVTGKLGRRTVQEVLAGVITEHDIDYVIAQGENTSHGKGLQTNHAKEMDEAGVQFFTGGNHSLSRTEALDLPNVLRPANLPEDTPGKGYAIADTPFGKIFVASLQGKIVGMHAERQLRNPLEVIDALLDETKDIPVVARIVNFHGDYSSEKVVIGQYLDGRVSAVIGDHWHVTTADAQVLPGGTAHITDVGMVGALDSSLGVETEIIVRRWKQPDERIKNEMEMNGRRQFNAVAVSVNPATALATDIKLVRVVLPA